MGIYDRDYMHEPEPPRRSYGSVVIVIIFLAILLAIAFLRQNPKHLHRLAAGFSRLIKKS